MIQNPFAFTLKASAVFFSLAAAGLTVLYSIYSWTWCLTAAISTGVTAYHFGMRLFAGWLVPAVTGNRFDYRKSWFQPRFWEPKLYKKLNLRKLKKHLPTYDPRQFDLAQNSLFQIIQNTCGAEIVHEVIMVFSFLPLILVPRFGELGVFLITSVAAALVDSLFVMAQRYNRPRLIKIYEKQEAKTH